MKIGSWLDERIGHREMLRGWLDHPIAGGPRWGRAIGTALIFDLGLLVVTGVVLMTAYSPSATTAWASVHHIDYAMESGWVVRGLHHFAAHVFVALLLIHLVRVAAQRAYTRPRELNWLLGLALFGVGIGFVITGNLLPWDQDGFWGAHTETNIIASSPGLGPALRDLLVGGREYGHLTLTRFYALHVAILPIAAGVLVAAHVALARRVAKLQATDRAQTYRQKQMGMDVLVGLVVVGVCFGLTFALNGAPLDGPADPSSDFPARPEWYFVPLSQLLEYFTGSLQPIATMVIPGGLALYLAALPFIDRKPTAGPLRRVLFLAPLVLAALGAGGLFAQRVRQDAADEDYQAARRTADTRRARAIQLAVAGVPPAGPLEMLRSDPKTRGAQLYQQHCATCHRLGDIGPAADKATAPDLTGFGGPDWARRVLEDPDADNLFGKTPFKGMMPSLTIPPKDPEAAQYFTAMPESDLQAVVNFLVGQANGDPQKGTRGEKLVRQRCTSCHRLDGETDDEDSLAPELRGWASSAWIEAQIEDPASGLAYPKGARNPELEGHMPAFAKKIRPDERKLLATWLVAQAAGNQ